MTHHTDSSAHTDANLYIPAGASASGSFDTVVDPQQRNDWTYTGLHIAALKGGEKVEVPATDRETMVVPLTGACTVTVDGEDYSLRGRPDVFTAATDVLYVGRDTALTVHSAEGGRFALTSAVAQKSYPTTLLKAEDIPVEVRGGGNMTRVVRNFGSVGAFDEMDSLIACEVITPSGNWSSYPAHKHDETTETESELEEIYYYEIQPGPDGTPGFGFHQTTSAHDDRPLDILSEVHAGDVVLVPHGWHGPCAAAPGHDMYYLNVMAGPAAVRAWNITDHPDQTWVRGTWEDAGADPRAVATAHHH